MEEGANPPVKQPAMESDTYRNALYPGKQG